MMVPKKKNERAFWGRTKKRPLEKRGHILYKKKREGNALNLGVKFLGALNLYMPIPLPLMNKMKTVLQQWLLFQYHSINFLDLKS